MSGITIKTIEELDRRMAASAEKYGAMKNQAECLGALRLEVHEIEHEMWTRDEKRLYDELLDAANVCIRYAQALRVKFETSGLIETTTEEIENA